MFAYAEDSEKSLASDENAARLCNELNNSIFSGDFDHAVDLTYPKVVSAIGGRAQYIELLKKLGEGQPGFKLRKVECQKPIQHSIVNGFTFALLPTTSFATVKGGTYKFPSSYLGISDDQGAKWTFLNLTPGIKAEQLTPLFPKGIGEITLLGKQEGVLIPDMGN